MSLPRTTPAGRHRSRRRTVRTRDPLRAPMRGVLTLLLTLATAGAVALAQPVHAREADSSDLVPVAGLDPRQMENAATIVAVGQEAGLPEHAYVVALAAALQESNLRVLASSAVPASFNHPHDGSGYDYDSVGLFQQRPSMGWGTVDELMDPAQAAATFYQALQQVPGWRDLPVTAAAQAVQRSAFPGHYAQHEWLARELVAALA